MQKVLFASFAVILLSLAFFGNIPAAHAQGATDILGLGYANNLGLQSDTGDPRDTAISIIRYLMTFLGIIAVCIILYGGFLWMTAAGNEDKVDKGKKAIIAGAIGLIVVLAAFAIVTFVVNITENAISGNF